MNVIIRNLTFLDNSLCSFQSTFKAKATNALFIGSPLWICKMSRVSISTPLLQKWKLRLTQIEWFVQAPERGRMVVESDSESEFSYLPSLPSSSPTPHWILPTSFGSPFRFSLLFPRIRVNQADSMCGSVLAIVDAVPFALLKHCSHFPLPGLSAGPPFTTVHTSFIYREGETWGNSEDVLPNQAVLWSFPSLPRHF